MSKEELIVLKGPEFLKKQKFAGTVLASIHKEYFKLMKGTGSVNLLDLGELAGTMIKDKGCTPTFLGYKGFPGTVCTSLNKEIVHGYPRDIELKDGDVIKIDIGVTFERCIADCAVTYVYGKAKSPDVLKMIVSCQEALHDGIDAFKVGNRIGDIGAAIFKRSKADGFGVIDKYGGHGIDEDVLHAAPFVPNKCKATDGVTIQPGMSIAIEPMFVIGKNTNTKTLKDKWTIATKEIGAHFEHSVTLDKDGNKHIITEHGICAKDFI